MKRRSTILSRSNSGLINKTLAVYAKDMRLEFRTKYAINAILLFGISTLAVVSFSLGQSGLSPQLLAALFWVVMFFSAMSGLAQVFIREEETGTSLALKLNADPEPIYFGKLFFNLTLMCIMTFIITPVFFIFTDAPTDNIPVFFVILILGVFCLCAATTLVAAIIARASVKGALFSVMSFPIMLPLLMVLVKGSEKALKNQPITEIATELQFLLSFTVIMIVLSSLLFKFVWQD